jgi:hypothetical protein
MLKFYAGYEAMTAHIHSSNAIRFVLESNYTFSTFHTASVSTPDLRPTQPPIQWVPGVFAGGKERQGRDADTSLNLVTKSRMGRSYTLSLPLVACMLLAGQLNFLLISVSCFVDYTSK